MHWIPEGNGYRCIRHGTTFGRLAHCVQCETAPGSIEVSSEALPVAPAGCVTSLDHERWFTTTSKYLARVAKALTEGQPPYTEPMPPTGAKFIAESIKARRAAMELTLTREDDAIIERAERRKRGQSH